MPTRPLEAEVIAHRISVLRKHNGNIQRAAAELGIGRQTLSNTIRIAGNQEMAAAQRIEDLGYQIPTAEKTPEEAWEEHAAPFEREVFNASKERNHILKRGRGAFVVFHSTDEHVDDNAAMLRQVSADIRAAHDLGAIMAHGGDILNNWPLAGKLAKQWAEQSCTLPDGLLRAQHFIGLFQPDFWTDGNHEEMNPYLANMLHGWLPAKTKRGYWTVNWTVETPDRPVRFSMSHKFQKGRSWFHPHHGVLREMMEGETADVYMEGHLHIGGSIERFLPERGVAALGVASAGYKVLDHYAARISRGGTVPKIKGRAHWIVCDPQADLDGALAKAFDCPRQAEAYLNGLQNLRAV